MCISFSPTLIMMHLCITQCTFWTPLPRGACEDIWRRSAGVFWKYSSTLHVFSINSLCFVSTFSLRGTISNGILHVVRGDRLIDPPDHFKGVRIPRDAGTRMQGTLTTLSNFYNDLFLVFD